MRKYLSILAMIVWLCLPVFTAQNEKALTGTTCPGAGCLNIDSAGAGTMGVQIEGTFVGTLQFEQTVDGTNWKTWPVLPNGSTSSVTSATAPGLWSGTIAGTKQVRVRLSAYTSGTATVSTVTAQARAVGASGGGSSNPFDQDLNTTDNSKFRSLVLNGGATGEREGTIGFSDEIVGVHFPEERAAQIQGKPDASSLNMALYTADMSLDYGYLDFTRDGDSAITFEVGAVVAGSEYLALRLSGQGGQFGFLEDGYNTPNVPFTFRQSLITPDVPDAVVNIYDNGSGKDSLLDVATEGSTLFRGWNTTAFPAREDSYFVQMNNSGLLTVGMGVGSFEIIPGGAVGNAGYDSGIVTYVGDIKIAATADLLDPDASVITQGGTPGSETVTYVLVGHTPLGYYTGHGADSITETSNATLDSDNYNIISWPASQGAISYDIYRVGGGPDQGLIAGERTLDDFPFRDTGLSGDDSDPPTTNTTGHVYVGAPLDVIRSITISLPNSNDYAVKSFNATWSASDFWGWYVGNDGTFNLSSNDDYTRPLVLYNPLTVSDSVTFGSALSGGSSSIYGNDDVYNDAIVPLFTWSSDDGNPTVTMGDANTFGDLVVGGADGGIYSTYGLPFGTPAHPATIRADTITAVYAASDVASFTNSSTLFGAQTVVSIRSVGDGGIDDVSILRFYLHNGAINTALMAIDDGAAGAPIVFADHNFMVAGLGRPWGMSVFASLPVCEGSITAGMVVPGGSSLIYDSATATIGATVTGGGSNLVLATCVGDEFGSKWVVASTLSAGGVINGVPQMPTVHVAGLPTCNSGAEGKLYEVDDALLPAALAIVASGGAVHVGVRCNGTNWIVF